MPLFHVQDNDRPLWVIAKNYRDADLAWKKVIAEENDMEIIDVENARGISFICDDNEIIL